MDIKAAVKQLTHKHNTNNPYELAQLLNIIVLYAELGKTWGYYTTYKRSKFIIINQNISEELQSYTTQAVRHPSAKLRHMPSCSQRK